MKTKVQVRCLKKGDVLASTGAQVTCDPFTRHDTPSGKTVVVTCNRGYESVKVWNKATTVTITNR